MHQKSLCTSLFLAMLRYIFDEVATKDLKLKDPISKDPISKGPILIDPISKGIYISYFRLRFVFINQL